MCAGAVRGRLGLAGVGAQKWRRPRCARIFFMRSRSSRSFMSSVLETTWPYLPSFGSFLRLSIQSGTLNWRGFWMMVTSRSTSSAVSSPALRRGGACGVRALRGRGESALHACCMGAARTAC